MANRAKQRATLYSSATTASRADEGDFHTDQYLVP